MVQTCLMVNVIIILATGGRCLVQIQCLISFSPTRLFFPNIQQAWSSNAKLSKKQGGYFFSKTFSSVLAPPEHMVSCVIMQNFTDVTLLISHKHITPHSGSPLQKAATCEMNKSILSQTLYWDFSWSPTAWVCSQCKVLKRDALLRTISKTI